MTDNGMDKKKGVKDNSKHLDLSTGRIDLPLTEMENSTEVQSSGGGSRRSCEIYKDHKIPSEYPREVITGQRS